MLRIKEALEEKQLEKLRELYEQAFPASEKKPFSLILQKRAEGSVEILAIEDEEQEFQGLIITMRYRDMVLVDYFAIAEERRNSGIGSKVLQLLLSRYKGKRIFLEIESTVSKDSPDYDIKIRRKRFYERNGLHAMNYLALLYGVEMEIMVFGDEVTFAEYHELVEQIYGEEAGRNVKLIK